MTTQSQAAKPPVTRFDAVIVGAGMVGAALGSPTELGYFDDKLL